MPSRNLQKKKFSRTVRSLSINLAISFPGHGTYIENKTCFTDHVEPFNSKLQFAQSKEYFIKDVADESRNNG